MKILYVLASNPKDTYYEQFLLSLTSLKLVSPELETILLCDTKTKETLTGNRTEYQKLISQVITVEAPGAMTQSEVSRWLKTSMRSHVKGDFLFIDSDTIITENISSISELGLAFAACLDKHSTLESHHMREYIISNNGKLNFNAHLSIPHYNSGIIFCKDTTETHNLFNRWHELWLFSNSRNIPVDQPSFNQAISENYSIFKELHGIWNCQICYNGLPFLAKSKIIHYFASSLNSLNPPFILASDSILKQIKESGKIPEIALKHLENPRAAFVSESRIITDNEMELVNSFIFSKLLWLKKRKPGLFDKLNNLSSFFTSKKRKTKSKL